MALRFMDGFDSYVTADLAKKWTESTLAQISTGTGRRGTQSLRGAGVSSVWSVTQILDAQPTWILGFAYQSSGLPSSARAIAVLLDAGTAQVSLVLNTDGTIELVRGTATAVTGGRSVLALSASITVYIECAVTIANAIAASAVQVRVNGVTWITVATGQDCQATANASANQVRFGPNSNAGLSMDYDDLYICDGTGSAPHNTFLGDCRVDTLLPTADGTSQQWTPSTPGTHYTLVDDAAPNTTDYVSSATIGHRDTYGMQDLAASTGTIYGVQLNLAAKKDDAGARLLKPLILSGASEALGASVGMPTDQLYYRHVQTTDPNTAAAWTESGVNAAQCGAEVA